MYIVWVFEQKFRIFKLSIYYSIRKNWKKIRVLNYFILPVINVYFLSFELRILW